MAAKLTNLSIRQLQLDLENPRFGLNEASSQDEAIEFLLQRSNLKELWDSYALKGFEPYEPLIGILADPDTWEDQKAPEYIIIEGNRRLAAAKTMLDPQRIESVTRKVVPELPREYAHTLQTLPVHIVSKREDAYDYIGFKHINGPSTWGSLAKAKFGVMLFESHKRGPHNDEENVLLDLSKRLGDTPSQALRSLVGYKIFEQAISLGYISNPSKNEAPVDFSHLYTMLPNPATRKYLGLGEAPLRPEMIRNNPISTAHLPKLKHLMRWLFGDEEHSPVIKRQGTDRPKLQKVLASSIATQTLEETGDFEDAVEQAGFAKDNWLSNIVKLAALSKTIYGSYSEMPAPLDDEERESAETRLRASARNVELTLKVL